MRVFSYLRGVNESHLVYRPVNVFFRLMEVMKVVVNCLSFYRCQTMAAFTFLHSSINANTFFTSKVSCCKQGRFRLASYLFVAQLLSCFDQSYLK